MSLRHIWVLKFGGTSMGNPAAVGQVVEIVSRQAGRGQTVTVVSAMAGVTDRLLALGQAALEGRMSEAKSEQSALRELHESTFLSRAEGASFRRWARAFLQRQFAEIEALVQGVSLLQEFSPLTRDKLLSYGEILSSQLLARALNAVNPRFCHSDARDWLIAEPTREGSVVDVDQTTARVRRFLAPLLRRGKHPVVPGFICRDARGQAATLGRNGSDYSASIVAAALKAHEIWIYTDVDGVMTADPGLVAEASILEQISYQEAAEMSYFGAKVLHPKTMIPAIRSAIPIRIKNTFRPRARGTLITHRSLKRPLVKTVTSVRNLALLNIQGNGMVGIPGVSGRLFQVLGREQINIIMISQSSSEHSICLVILAKEADKAVREIQNEFRLEIDRGLLEPVAVTRDVALVSIIGAGMRGTPGISGRFFSALGKHRINVLAIAQGSSELNISAVILEKDYRAAVQAIHTSFGLTRDLHVFLLGCGNIGRKLLEQVVENRKDIAAHLQVQLKILGVAGSRFWRFSTQGLNGGDLRSLASGTSPGQLPESEPRPADEEILSRLQGTLKSDIVLVDATSEELARLHLEALRRGFHVVTANKKPLTNAFRDYQQIQKLRRRKGLQYQYEATFGAGLPLLHTLQDLIQTGDEIIEIQGCLSGTLGLLCSRLDARVSFSRAVGEAMEMGYTEPDPRDDLSGRDVARKALIIAREIGISLELEQIELQAMIPGKYFRAASVKEFLKRLPAADAPMAARAREAGRKGAALRYVATITRKGCRVGLQCVPRESPVGRLAGPDNILVFKTQRYFDHPLVIQGPGAGAGVTAAGVLGDILKIAKSI